jgi:hypothetical protein
MYYHYIYKIFIGITYYTTDDLEKVTQFYFDEMPKYDWNLVKLEALIAVKSSVPQMPT